jgi:WD40 repeat protein
LVLGWDGTKAAPPIQRFDVSGRRTISIAVSVDGKLLAAGSADGTVMIWQVDSGTRLATLRHHGGPVAGLAFSQSASKLVAAGEGGFATIWDVKSVVKKQE